MSARQALRQIAAIVGNPGAEREPDRLVHLVNDEIECLKASVPPDTDDGLRELITAWGGLRVEDKVRLQLLAQALSSEDPYQRAMAWHLFSTAEPRLRAQLKRFEAGLRALTRNLDEHPDDYDLPCECKLCLSYG